MNIKELRDASTIVRVDPGSRSTPARDACADWLETEIVDTGRWPLPVTKLSELSHEAADDPDSDVEQGWSRQHISNVLDFYFAPQRNPDVDVAESLQLDIKIPSTVTNRDDYLRGYLDGLRDDL